MFAMLGGALPGPPDADDDETALAVVLDLQADSGLEPITDAGLLPDLDPVARWRRVRDRTDRLVCATLTGPWTAAVTQDAGGPRPEALQAAAETSRSVLGELEAAGCRMVRIDEPTFVDFPDDASSRAAVVEVHRRSLDGSGLHAVLSVTGGDAMGLGAETLYRLPYHSHLFDLVRGPESWRLVVAAPPERGIVCGVVPTMAGDEVVKELMVWAAHYAASTGRRGLDRVGLATAGDLDGLDWEVAAARVRLLGRAALIAADASPEHLARELDPGATGMKSAALGRGVPPPGRATRPNGGAG